MKLDLSKYQAVIFDIDGTMIDNADFHKKAWIEFCRRHGMEINEEYYYQKLSGRRNDAVFELLFGKKIIGEEYDKLDEEKESIYRGLYKPFLKELTGLKEFLDRLKQKNIRLAVATTSPSQNRKFVLETLELKDYFNVIVGGEHATHGKPHPEIYLLAAEKLGVDPEDCLAFEDTPSGIASAKAAGMTVVGVLTAHSKEELKQADFYIKDFTDIDI